MSTRKPFPRHAALALIAGMAACLGACNKSGRDQATGPVPDPTGIDRLASRTAFPGWYHMIRSAWSGGQDYYYHFQADGVYHRFTPLFWKRSGSDSIPTHITWDRGTWLRAVSSGMPGDSALEALFLGKYESAPVRDTAGLRPGWQSLARMDSTRDDFAWFLGFKHDTISLRTTRDDFASYKFVRIAAPAFLGFDPGGIVPRISGGKYDRDGDAEPDVADADIDGDGIANAEDCMPFSRYYFVTAYGGSCVALEAPTGLKAKSGDTQVFLSWDQGYTGSLEVEYAAIPASAAPGGNAAPSGGGMTITGLRNGIRYGFRLRSMYKGNSHPQTATAECMPLAAPKDVRAETVRDTLKITWSGEGSPGFRVLYWPGAEPADTLKAMVAETTIPKLSLTGLAEGEYGIAVRGVSGEWHSPLSAIGKGVFASGMREWGAATPTTSLGATALALEQDSTPMLVYSDSLQQNTLAVAALRQGKWVAIGAPGIRKPSRAAVIRFAPDGTPYVLFRDDNLGKLDMVRLKGGAWESAGLQEFLGTADWGSARIEGNADLAFAKDGTAYVAFADPARLHHLTVLRSVAAGWEAVERRGFSAGTAYSPRLAMGKDGSPRVAWIDPANGSAPVVKALVDGHWEYVGSTAVKARGGLCLALDGQDRPALSFTQGEWNSSTVAVLRFDGTAWIPAPIPTSFSATEAAVDFAPDGTLYLAMETRYLYRWTGSAWASVGPERFPTGSYNRNVSLRIGATGTPWVSHTSNLAKGSVVTVRAFAY